MSSDPGNPYHLRPQSDDTAQLPVVPPAAGQGGGDAAAGGPAGPVHQETTRIPRLDPAQAPQGWGRHEPPPAGGWSGSSWWGPEGQPPSERERHTPSGSHDGPPPGWQGQPDAGSAAGNQRAGSPGAALPAWTPSAGPGADATTQLPGVPTAPYGQGGQAQVPPRFPDGGPAPVPEKKPKKWMMPAVAAGIVVALLLVVTGGTVAFAGEVPRGTTVLGVDIGGRSKAEAAAALKQGLGKRVTEPVTVMVGKSEGKVDPKKIGLTVDYAATADKAAQRWPNPFTVLFGERLVDPVVKVDGDKLDAALQKLAEASTEKITRPAVRYEGLTPKPIYPGAGRGLDPDESAKALRAGWLRDPKVAIPVVEIKTVTTKEDVDKLVADLAEPAVAAPVTVTTPDGDFSIPPKAIAKSLIMESDAKGEIVPRLDAKKLHAAAKKQFAEVEVEPKDAKPAIQGGKLVVSAETPGKKVALKGLVADMLPVLRESGNREVSADLVPDKPKLTKEKVEKLGIKEKISSFTTNFQGGQDRNKNILVVADEVDNALVLPGKKFSLNGYTGERSYAQGYVDAPVIIDGKIKNYVGGGISQFATTLFNAYYYAGLVDVYHQPHGYYISRYPPVIEATVFYPSLDLKFKNDSQYGVLIDTSYTDTSITVTMWSTKRYDIKTEWKPKYDEEQPKEVHLKEKDCIPTAGIPGFKQEAFRIFIKDGKEIKRERFFWHYKAEPKFVCDNPEK